MAVNKFIFVINGSNGSGKDTFVDFVRDRGFHSDPAVDVSNISSIDIIKGMAKKYGWDGEKDEKGRELLQKLKEVWDNYNSLTQTSIFTKTKSWYNRGNFGGSLSILFVHIREPEKIGAFIKSCDKYFSDAMIGSVLVKSKRTPVANNPSDMGVNQYKYDIYIDNDGTEEQLSEKAEEFINTIISISNS